jgi:soluble lytic murein transglycosylase
VYPEAAQWGLRAAEAERSAQLPFLHAMRLAYPAAYFDIVSREAAKHGVDPLVIWAVMRQESFYDPLAVSRKGAIGLLQVMPATLLEMQGDGGSLPVDALFVPRVNIRLGVDWFARRYGDFDRRLYPTLASYNAGVTKCREWIERAGGDTAEVFQECIGYPETYDYVRRIVWIRWLYGGAYHGDLEPPDRGAGG